MNSDSPVDVEGRDDAWWTDVAIPLEAEDSRRQITTLLRLAGSGTSRILDLGCGAGRTLLPLVQAGHVVTGIDRDGVVLQYCRERLQQHGGAATLLEGDFRDPRCLPEAPFDLVTCLGNTWMEIVDVQEAATLLADLCGRLATGGRIVIDDIPGTLLPERASGNWCTGMSADGSLQMIWEPGSDLFCLRSGDAVDPDNWSIGEDEPLRRLWTDEVIADVARAGGLSVAEREPGSLVLIMQADAPPRQGPPPVKA